MWHLHTLCCCCPRVSNFSRAQIKAGRCWGTPLTGDEERPICAVSCWAQWVVIQNCFKLLLQDWPEKNMNKIEHIIYWVKTDSSFEEPFSNEDMFVCRFSIRHVTLRYTPSLQYLFMLRSHKLYSPWKLPNSTAGRLRFATYAPCTNICQLNFPAMNHTPILSTRRWTLSAFRSVSRRSLIVPWKRLESARGWYFV